MAGVAGLLGCTALTAPAFAQESEDPKEDIVVTGSLDALPLKDVGTVFGFDKTLTETPRSVSTVSQAQIERFGVTSIYDLIAQAPGTFTNSFFGVGGSLDIRGTPGEVYFRGLRRLDNPGNYPTPIGAADRIDIVRGPASPIMGPAKTGGYINFVPKSARAGNGSYLAEPKAEFTYTRGSWNNNMLSASVVGPGSIGQHEFGYSLYGELTDSDSYYDYIKTRQTLIQASFDTDITPDLRIEFGGMYDNYKGTQNGGWNRVTQELIDNGTYITGQAKPLDTDGDGKISPAEARAANGGLGLGTFGGAFCTDPPFDVPFAFGLNNTCLATLYPDSGLTNVGTTKLSRRKTLTGPNDFLNNVAKTLYADLIWDGGNDLEIKNQLFYDGYKNSNENAYGFSQFADSYVIEDKIVISKKFTSNAGTFSIQAAPSIRYTKFKHADDFGYEYFGRVDLTEGYTPLSTRLLSTQTDSEYSSYFQGHYTDAAFSLLADLDFAFGLDVTLGGRYDRMSVSSTAVLPKIDPTQFGVNIPLEAVNTPNRADGTNLQKDTKGVWSWTASANYKLPFGLIPYATIAKQSVIITGQGAEVDPSNVYGDSWITSSKLYEGGIKGSWLDNRLYAALSIYKQNRTDYSIQSLTVNQAIKTTGIEAEMRWSVNRHLLLTTAYTHTKVVNQAFLNGGGVFFYYYGADLLAANGIDPTLILGAAPNGLVPLADKSMAERPTPRNIYSGTASYAFDNGIALTASAYHVGSMWADYPHTLRLPAYTLVDLGVSYETDHWLFQFNLKNALNERYFRANFVELYASQNIKPELPRSWQASIKYKF
ncbi:TonB-dependent siderophore receptor [Novosphingobium album (ex Liu et al. 2023)]|uniref:TonB-dependent receptor plug domain-containing protein n=1 Tax=Novosphingobium album (ex Liu et al. 2023) TaxID=3031130 RepID=A0ABT5WJR6_9SPHN|nr:TonB-dependent receptor [Novosphingobium album (ex Liu et al. 2023)]MDE8650288.1 TonB-dependent receptor plug domain-containing protein [Novosphingobium album (ex Liu et al. 2023)]